MFYILPNKNFSSILNRTFRVEKCILLHILSCMKKSCLIFSYYSNLLSALKYYCQEFLTTTFTWCGCMHAGFSTDWRTLHFEHKNLAFYSISTLQKIIWLGRVTSLLTGKKRPPLPSINKTFNNQQDSLFLLNIYHCEC